MALVKNWHVDPESVSEDLHIECAMESLQKALHRFVDTECEKYRKVAFIAEQLQLLTNRKNGRHYSPQLLILSYLIATASSAAYEVLVQEDVLSPTIEENLNESDETIERY